MLAPGKLYPGTQIDLTINLQNAAEADVDPATLTFKLMSPDGVETTYVYGTDAEITKQSVGDYTARITPDKAGRWHYRWITTGSGTVLASEGDFLVQRSVFVDDPDARMDYR
jgi:hypothetical protein